MAGLIALALDDSEREILRRGLNEWQGPARPTTEIVCALGFDPSTFWQDLNRLIDDIRERRPLAKSDWVRALLAAEVAFIDSFIGSGLDWRSGTGLEDGPTLAAFRRLQDKIRFADVVGHDFGTPLPNEAT